MAMTEEKREVLRLARKIVESQPVGHLSICDALEGVGLAVPRLFMPAHSLLRHIQAALGTRRPWLELWQQAHLGSRCVIAHNRKDRLAWIDWLIACPTDDELALAEACANGWTHISGGHETP